MNYDFTSFFNYLNRMNLLLKNENLANLINANTIGNLPSLNITTNNTEIQQLQACSTGPIFLGVTADEASCKKICGSSGRLLNVYAGQEIFSNGQQLTPGAWCTVNRPNCNFNTTYAVATVNSVACRSKYPRMFGGDTGNRVIACNNSQYFNPSNVLWDNLYNKLVNPINIRLVDTDEKLPDGSYRFMCKFGDDYFGNQFISHRIDRLHPMRNYCNKDIYRAHRLIQQNSDGTCDCGNYQDTRVKNQIPDDPTTTCTPCFNEKVGTISKVGIDCFTINSIYYDVYRKMPCLPSKFVSEGTFCETLEINTSETDVFSMFPFHSIIHGFRFPCERFSI